MEGLFHKVSQKVQEVAQQHSQQTGIQPGGASSEQSGGHFRQGLPDFVFQAVDNYVDSLAPHISPVISKEIDTFQSQTIDSLEAHLKEAFRAVFKGDFSAFRRVGDVDQLFVAQQRSDTSTNTTQPPNSYGQRGLPFAPSAPGMGLNQAGSQERALSGGQMLMSAIAAGFDKGGSNSSDNDAAQRERNIFQDALNKVSDFAKTQAQEGGGDYQQLMGRMATEIDKVNADPDEMAKKVVPEMKIKIGELLTRYHAPLAEKMTTAALAQLKKWLRGNTSARDLGEGAKSDITDAITGFFGKASISQPPAPLSGGTRDLQSNTTTPPTGDSQPHGIAGILSKKLSHGLTNVRSSTRDDFRVMLSMIEKTLFDELPESIRGPLAKIFGGDPLDPSVPSTANRNGQQNRGFSLFEELGDKFKAIIERVQKGLRDRVLEVVGGGHRRLEALAWVQVQETVVTKVQKYVPGVKVDIEQEDEAMIHGQQQQQQTGGSNFG
ncbi:hypothetical protein HWV62_35470 [Athelia sp. TMB]|nr:hypothetical protein HWV62_4397 [Athelia sp. TMB]KAF7981030.1 hypothetical protein HWV62_35470 [Athelia sp. TMB]